MAIKWTKEDDKQLKTLYGTMKAKDLGTILNRTEAAIYKRAGWLGLTEKLNYHFWTPMEDSILTDMVNQGCSHQMVADKLDMNIKAVHHRAHRLGLSKPVGANYILMMAGLGAK